MMMREDRADWAVRTEWDAFLRLKRRPMKLRDFFRVTPSLPRWWVLRTVLAGEGRGDVGFTLFMERLSDVPAPILR